MDTIGFETREVSPEQVYDRSISHDACGTRIERTFTPYSETTTARVLSRVITEAGLALPQDYVQEAAQNPTVRYGSPYAWLTRQLIKQARGFWTPLNSLVVAGTENREDAGGALNVLEVPYEERFTLTDDAPANLVLDMLNQLRDRVQTGDMSSDVPVGVGNSMHDSCKDAETYFVASGRHGRLRRVAFTSNATGDTRQFWHKLHGGYTYLNLEPVKARGITLPPGFLFRVEPTGLLPMRATGFAFDQGVAEEVFGKPMAELWYERGEGSPDLADARATFAAFAERRSRLAGN